MSPSIVPVQFTPPSGMAAVRSVYGDFSYTELSQGNIKPDHGWEMDNLVVVKNAAGSGLSVQLHHLVVPIFTSCLAEAMRRCPGYKVRMLGGYCPRHKMHDPKRDLSIHSWGAAVDVNWDTNTVGSKATAKVDLPDDFIAAFTEQGWDWGGNWSSILDYMHFQYAVNC